MKKKIVTVIGVRPEFIRIKYLADELSKYFDHKIVHTGQHHDFLMSKVFFKELQIVEPNYFLSVESEDTNLRLGKMLIGLTDLIGHNIDGIIVHGDTDSTLAGALFGAKNSIQVIHVEAGMRNYDLNMPEEVNRKITDHVSSVFFCSSNTSLKNLANEGIVNNVYISGDLMLDVFLRAKFDDSSLSKYRLSKKQFFYCTIHRAENTEDEERFLRIFKAISKLKLPVIFPAHPRSKKLIAKLKLKSQTVRIVEPATYLENLSLMNSASAIFTDSGGIQKEAYWLKVPCFTLRSTTEWVETVKSGWNQLVLKDINNLSKLVRNFKEPDRHLQLYGDGKASVFIAKKLNDLLND